MESSHFSNLLPPPDRCRQVARLNRLAKRGSSPGAEFAARWSADGGEYSVYCLSEGGRRIRYIGITNQSPEVRLAQHLADCGRGRNIYKENWLRSCAKRNIQVTIHVVRSGLTAQQAGMIEEMLIKLLKKPFGLTNTHAGGSTGYAGLSDESREKHRLNTKKAWARLIDSELQALDSEGGDEELAPTDSDSEGGKLRLISVSRPMLPLSPDPSAKTPPASEERATWETELTRTFRNLGLAWRTEQSYRPWVTRFASFLAPRTPIDADGNDVSAFLTSLAVDDGVSRANQRQALSAVLLLMQDALRVDLGEIEYRAAPTRSQPRDGHTILSQIQCSRLFTAMDGQARLMATLLYSACLRLGEVISLRVQDLDLEQQFLNIRSSRGGLARIAPFSGALEGPIRFHLESLSNLWWADKEGDSVGVWVPQSVAKRQPRAGAKWAWQWLFPSKVLMADPSTGVRRRHHVSDAFLQSALRSASKESGFTVPVSSKVLRISAIAHLLEADLDFRVIRELLRPQSVDSAFQFTRESCSETDALPK